MTQKYPHVPDHGLWDDVKRTIQPLGKRKPAPLLAPRGTTITKAAAPTLHHRREPPPLAAFDRRTSQKLSRGQQEPDSRLDLHGESAETARMKLYHYLCSAQQRGDRLVLVITGKGASPYARHTLHGRDTYHTPEREGRLRREVPFWLGEALFRAHVVGYQPAHPRHGGGGAFYIRLRRHT
jgi:DNA-nicking Smr family endonuclease